MNAIQMFEKKMNEMMPAAVTRMDAPDNSKDLWFLNLDLDNHDVVVTWSEKGGFGLISREVAEYGIYFDESYERLDDAFERALFLLRTLGRTESEDDTTYLLKSPVMKKRLVEALGRTGGMSLEEVRAKLGI